MSRKKMFSVRLENVSDYFTENITFKTTETAKYKRQNTEIYRHKCSLI